PRGLPGGVRARGPRADLLEDPRPRPAAGLPSAAAVARRPCDPPAREPGPALLRARPGDRRAGRRRRRPCPARRRARRDRVPGERRLRPPRRPARAPARGGSARRGDPRAHGRRDLPLGAGERSGHRPRRRAAPGPRAVRHRRGAGTVLLPERLRGRPRPAAPGHQPPRRGRPARGRHPPARRAHRPGGPPMSRAASSAQGSSAPTPSTQRPSAPVGPRRRRVPAGLGPGALGLALLPLTACTLGAARAEDGAATPPDELSFLISNLDGGWVPSKSAISSYEANVWQQLTDKLVHTDAEGNVTPWIATRWEQNEDATEYVLHLREGVTFSDGTVLDADAVLANLEAWAVGRPEEGLARVGLFPGGTYAGAEALDDLTVRVSFSAPTLSFLPT